MLTQKYFVSELNMSNIKPANTSYIALIANKLSPCLFALQWVPP